MTVPVGLAARGVVPGTTRQQLSSGSISGLSGTKPLEFHISGGSSPRPPQFISLHCWHCPVPSVARASTPLRDNLSGSARISYPKEARRGIHLGVSLPSSLSRGRRPCGVGVQCVLRRDQLSPEAFGAGHFARGSTPQLRAPCVVQARNLEAPRVPRPPTQGSRAPPSGRRAASLRPRLVGGAAHVTTLRACGRCRFPQSPSEREETRWRLKAIRSGALAIRIEPSPSTRFRRPGPSRPALRASPPGLGAPHRHPSARPSPFAFPSPPASAPT